MRNCLPIGTYVLGLAFYLGTGFANAQAPELGMREYINRCAVCHGAKGKGDGPLAEVLNRRVVDLTTLKKRNKGVLPYKRLYDVIDGRKLVKGHGTREMPVWGDVFSEQSIIWLDRPGRPADVKSFVRSRIDALIGYIDRLQSN